MAYLAPTADGGNFYNVNFAAGNYSPNRRDDVYLVQWMLRHIYGDSPHFVAPEKKPLVIDGWIGPQTVKWIKAFQNDACKLGLVVTQDGRIDSARKSVGAVSKKPYTILIMNAAFRDANPDAYSDPGSDPLMPPDLLGALAVKTGDQGPFEEPEIRVPASGGI